jgi:hypothetical protein
MLLTERFILQVLTIVWSRVAGLLVAAAHPRRARDIGAETKPKRH